jgi:hypothetical protein
MGLAAFSASIRRTRALARAAQASLTAMLHRKA